jgi:hypothetical protein
MRRPWKQHNEFSALESDLRAARPQPRPDLISQLVERIEAVERPFRRSRSRLVFASVLTGAALVAFALVGGFNYTAMAASAVAHATGISKAPSSNAGNGNSAHSNANTAGSTANSSSSAQYQERITICHRPPGNPSNGQTLRLPPSAAQSHLAHHPDDTLGPCP